MISNAPEIHAELERILASRWLKDSHQLRALLTHLVEQTLAGQTDGLKEHTLGLEVFHRPVGYDPRLDAIVRVQASSLRKRLASYYENEGRYSPLRIELPRGCYVPVFHTAPTNPEPRVTTTTQRWAIFAGGLLAGAALTVLAGYWAFQPPQAEPVLAPSLWSAFLTSGKPTIASFGVPLFFAGGDGLFVRDTQVNTLQDDSSRIEKVGKSLGRAFRPQPDVYTGVGETAGIDEVSRWLETRGVPVEVANSNYLGPSDLQDKNLIVISSARFQTLLHQMNLPRRIVFEPESNPGAFRLESPREGELARYQPQGSDAGVSTSYAVISLWPGPTPGTRILYLSGIETWSTQGAARYVLDATQMKDLQSRLDADPLDGPRGHKGPFFQVLLRLEGKNNRLRTAHYVTHRYVELPRHRATY